MNTLINKILDEWAYRVHDGMPNPKNPLHIVHLKESMQWLQIPERVIDGFVNNLSGNIITEISKRDLQTRIISIGKGLGTHSNLGRVKNDDDISDSDFIKLIKKEFGVDKVDIIKPGSGENKSAKFPLFKWNTDGQDLSITLAGKVTGRGTAQTKDQEMSFLLVLSALQYGADPTNKEEFISVLLDSNVYGRVYDGSKISESTALGLAAWLENNDDWYKSHIKQCQGFMSTIGNKQATKYVKDESKLDVNISAKTLYKNEYGENLDLDKWNPADVWLYYDKAVPEHSSLTALNMYMYYSIKSVQGVIGISLKKGSGILGYKNYHEPDKINLKKVDLKMSALGSLAGTLSFVGDGVDDMSLAFRIFSAKDTDLIRGEGEKKGAEAVQGKVALELLDTFTGKSWKRSITAAGGADILELEKGKWIFTTNGKKKFKTAKANWAFISKRRNLTFARGASKVNHSNAFRSEKTFLTWLNKQGKQENAAKAWVNSKFQVLELFSKLNSLSVKEEKKLAFALLKYAKSESEWSSAHLKLE